MKEKSIRSDFNTMSDRIKQVEKDLGTMKSNLNVLYGAIQQVDRLITKVKGGETKKPNAT